MKNSRPERGQTSKDISSPAMGLRAVARSIGLVMGCQREGEDQVLKTWRPAGLLTGSSPVVYSSAGQLVSPPPGHKGDIQEKGIPVIAGESAAHWRGACHGIFGHAIASEPVTGPGRPSNANLGKWVGCYLTSPIAKLFSMPVSPGHIRCQMCVNNSRHEAIDT